MGRLRERVSRRRRPPPAAGGEALQRGAFTYGEPLVRRYEGDTARVIVGAFCSIADEVVFVPGGNHRTEWVSTFPFRAVLGLPGAFADGHPASKGDIVVGNDVWIGRGATLLSGVTVGDGAVIGASSVVVRDVEPYTIVAGNPAKPIRRRFTDDEIAALLRIRWWEWPVEQIRAHVDELSSPDVRAFIARFDR
jgi:acetyltransferase-like isoleucine patch superfamily enzyme